MLRKCCKGGTLASAFGVEAKGALAGGCSSKAHMAVLPMKCLGKFTLGISFQSTGCILPDINHGIGLRGVVCLIDLTANLFGLPNCAISECAHGRRANRVNKHIFSLPVVNITLYALQGSRR